MRTLICCVTVIALLAPGGVLARERPARSKTNLKAGDKAPDFTLKLLGSDGKFKLSSNFGKKPTVLVFGSYT